MSREEKARHEHSGLSSKGLFSTKKLLKHLDLKENEVILDLGCGSGFISIALAKRYRDNPKSKIYSLDVDEKAIQSLEKKISKNGLENIKAIHADATKHIPIPKKIPGPPLSERISLEELNIIMSERGFEKVKSLKVGLLHYGTIFIMKEK
ncbi:MAG: methyltransferase domain-containing protein [Promethearchaeota archaeon]